MPMPSWTTAVATAALVAATGCDRSHDTPDAVFVRDSAGVRIIESRAAAWDSGDAWTAEPSITVGSTNAAPGQELHRVNGAVRSSDGGLIVANGGSLQLFRYDASGKYLGAIGRKGEGPGEFTALSWLGKFAGDTLVTWDRGLDRISVFAPAGAFVTEVRPALPENPMSLEVKGALSDGHLLLARGASFIPAGNVEGTQRQPITGWMIDRAGRHVQSFGPFPGETVVLKAGSNGSSMSRTPVPFGASTLFSARGDAVYIADGDQFAVRVYAGDGKLVRIVRRPYTRIRVLPEDVAAYIETQVENGPPVQWIRDGIRASFERVTPADSFPAIRSLQIDTEDHLWVESSRHAGDRQAMWTVFAPNGTLLGDVALPRELQIFEIGRDYIIGRDRDDLGVERVKMLRVTKPAGSPLRE
jgi:hypothetical protein